jgi:hypothetical protein
MNLRTGFTFLGAILPLAGVIGTYFGLGGLGARPHELGILAGIVAGLVVLSYIIAAVSATTSFGEFMRGWLIGLNTALNVVLAVALGSAIAGSPAGAVFGLAIGVLNLLCTLAPLSQNGFFQGLIGWLNWILPMSWLVVALGFLFYLFSFVIHAVTLGRVPYLRVQGLGMDWATGTFFIKGGLIANLNPLDTAFNMGNFSFVDYQSGQWHMDHEAGHTLNLAAFGCVFHLVGALDENLFRQANAYSERLAESNSSGTAGSNIPMWS